MDLDHELTESLLRFDWFSRCGDEISAQGVEKARTVSSVKKTIQSTRYENVVLEHQGGFTTALFTSYRQEYNKWWNALVDQFKTQCLPPLKDIWESRLEPLGLNEPYVLNDLSFNVLSASVIGAYRDCLPMPEFYQKMLEIYKSGHLICGWKGKKENGSFIVY